MSIVQTIAACQRGEPEAFTPLVRRYQNLALAYAFSQLGDFHQAQDVVQEAFLVAYRRLGQLQKPEAFASWLRQIVHTQCQRVFRKHRHPLLPFEESLDAGVDEGISEALERAQEARKLAEAIKSLPEDHRTIVTLYYLQEHSQKQVAEFLEIGVARVNNILHESRQRLKRRLKAMRRDPFREQRLDEEFARNIGEIIEVRGALVETRHEAKDMPQIFDALGSQRGESPAPGLVVIQRLKDGRLRSINVGSPTAAQTPLYAAGGPLESLGAHNEQRMQEALEALGWEIEDPGIVETGIKALDLFCPVPRGALVGNFGKEGVGRAVFVMELIHRQQGPLSLLFFASRWTALGTQDQLRLEPAFATDVHDHLQTAWLVHPKASDPLYARDAAYLDVSLFFSPLLAARGLWPALDPLFSRSNALLPERVGARHVELAEQARELLAETRALMRDPLYLEYLALDAKEAAHRRLEQWTQERLAALEGPQKQRLLRGRRLEMYLTQPFYVAEDFTRRPGATVALEDTLNDVEAILEGAYDEVEEAQLMWKGAL